MLLCSDAAASPPVGVCVADPQDMLDDALTAALRDVEYQENVAVLVVSTSSEQARADDVDAAASSNALGGEVWGSTVSSQEVREACPAFFTYSLTEERWRLHDGPNFILVLRVSPLDGDAAGSTSDGALPLRYGSPLGPFDDTPSASRWQDQIAQLREAMASGGMSADDAVVSMVRTVAPTWNQQYEASEGDVDWGTTWAMGLAMWVMALGAMALNDHGRS